MKRIDRTGQVFGHWTVVRFHSKYGSCDARWLCRCVCGAEKLVIYRSLTSGRSQSCGCLTINLRIGKLTKHGYAGTPTYKSWHAMIQRCQGKGGHEQYVANGITVCKEWLDFSKFLSDMGDRPEGTSLDRIDGNKGYCKENCRWATHVQQMNNKKTNVKGVVDGAMLSPSEAARKYGVGISMVRHRLRKGFSLEQAVKIPRRHGQSRNNKV